MRAMVLAAGMGTRLRPLTDHRPKALVEVAGRSLLEIVLARLRAFGIREVIVNVHHFADMVSEYLVAHHNFGMRIELSREEELLDTGGGLKKAAWFLQDDSRIDEPFILHNVDVLSTINFEDMVRFHTQSRALATLAVQNRNTARYLLFDGQQQLCGRRTGHDPKMEMARPAQRVKARAFSGIHVISQRLLTMMTEEGAFSIIDCYLRLAARGEKVLAFPADEYYWRDLGRPESVNKATEDVLQKALVL